LAGVDETLRLAIGKIALGTASARRYGFKCRHCIVAGDLTVVQGLVERGHFRLSGLAPPNRLCAASL
jgi:hypothetical protein